MWRFGASIVLSAFLLFQIQPMTAKWMLPVFGGTAAVWTTCMLFFQTALLFGYLYADLAIRRLPPRLQAALHFLFLGIGLVLLVLRPEAARDVTGGRNPLLGITALLAFSVGIPYLVLSSTTPIIQAWYARSHKGVLPYRLFALSNFASILGLVAYPFLVEPYLPVRRQFQVWSWAYVLFAVLCFFSAVRSIRPAVSPKAPKAADDDGARPGWDVRLIWIALAACASILLLAVTNHLSQNVAPVPLLSVVPLAVYLLSFVLCFERDDWSSARVWRWMIGPTLGALGLMLLNNRIGGLVFTVSIFAAALFLCCMFCHSELARLKPHARYLSAFYLMVSAGGAAGGLFVGLVAPMVFNSNMELPVGMAFCAILALQILRRTYSPGHLGRLLAVGFAGLLVCVKLFAMGSGTLLMARNFYGSLRVRDEILPSGPPIRVLYHGSIVHGIQFLAPDLRKQTTAYYGPQSGVARAIAASHKPGMRVGVVGLGTGTLAAAGQAGDSYRFYEINDLVMKIAKEHFTFLRDSPSKVELVLGDGRLAMDREPPQNFDFLVLDVFLGDSIPVHVITKEAFQIYFRHLRSDGVLAVNVSNQYLDVKSIVERLAEAFGRQAVTVHSADDPRLHTLEATWVLVAPDGRFEGMRNEAASHSRADVWTDDYSNLLRAMR